MKQIPLTQGMFALVDDQDFEELSKYKWCAAKYGKRFYAVRGISLGKGKKTTIKMHRFLLGADNPSIHCDHINKNGLDNQRNNLRACLPSENYRNRDMQSNNTSGYKGVHIDKRNGNFIVHICVEKKQMHIGSFKTDIEAARAYDVAARSLHREFASLNFP